MGQDVCWEFERLGNLNYLFRTFQYLKAQALFQVDQLKFSEKQKILKQQSKMKVPQHNETVIHFFSQIRIQ